MAASNECMIAGIDCRDVAGCTCLGLRRVGRMATQIFDAHLQPAGLTIGQFGILTRIHAGALSGPPITMKELSNAIGMDPTTLNRTLKPLEAEMLVRIAPDVRDRRARCIAITTLGRKRLERAMPLWRAADSELRKTIGRDTARALDGLLGAATVALRKSE
ncbi:MAG TPA: MarR family transcriptional regulator [Rhizomicrobium sp.]|nr:MarR family transcriptional regulator [Rhizomicrobium sp.]